MNSENLNHKERMIAGLPYKAWLSGLEEDRVAVKKLIYRYNQIMPGEWDDMDALLRRILGKAGKDAYIEPPFHCDYGYNIEVGDTFYANYNLVILDVCKVRIGDNAMLGPNVAIYTAGHPIHPKTRNSGYEYGEPVTIGNNVWIGGNACIMPGVTIGDNAVIGAGSVVTHDIPANVVAVGNPCRPIREITEADRDFYARGKRFDVDDY